MIELKNIKKSFGDKEVIKGVNLNVNEGEVVTLIGRSGSGKTTLLRMMNALELPTEGQVWVNGETYTNNDKKSQIRVRKQSGMVFQNYNLFPHKTAIENVMEGLIVVKKMNKQEARKRAESLLEKVGLTNVKDQHPSALSGGQQQRVAIARALVSDVPIILADEPTGNLDEGTANDIINVLQNSAYSEGKCVIVVTHSKHLAKRADIQLELKNRRIKQVK